MLNSSTSNDLTGQVSILIKTFQRPHTVRAAVASIRRFYPNLPIIVADDSSVPVDFDDGDVTVYRLPFDSGVGKGRNFLLSQVRTPYLLMCDDDHFFTGSTRIERMLDLLEAEDFDILSCLVLEGDSWWRGPKKSWRRVLDFQMDLDLKEGTLRFIEPAGGYGRHAIRCDLVHQFFLARTEAIVASGGWDDRLKTSDHTDFFLRTKQAGLKVGFTPTVAVKHEDIQSERRSTDYFPFRHKRLPEFRRVWIQTHGIERLVGRNGTVLSAQDFIEGLASIGKLGNLAWRPAPPGFLFWNRFRAASVKLLALLF
jgi:glycosyltransferase involved in cell wall biosynthesis